MHAADEQQWESFLERLLVASRAALARFAAEHADEELCAFAYDSDPGNGYVLIALNTSAANLAYVRKQHENAVAMRRQILAQPHARQSAYYHVKANSVRPFCDNTGDFAYQDFAEVSFPEWQELFESASYKEPAPGEDDYLESHAALIFARAIDTLVDEGAFAGLRLASPTLLSFAFHDQPSYVLRMLRLPGDERSP